MKVEKRGGLKHVRIHHNKTIFWIIVVLFFILLVIIFSIKQIGNHRTLAGECASDSDCADSTCCHAVSCVPANQSPKCEGAMCTLDCRPNTTDCGQGSCACIENKCTVKWSAGE